MSLLYNLARMTTATTGTGTITLAAAVSGYLSFSTAGVTDQQIVSYGIRDGANSEVGYGLYTASGTTLTRNVTKSTNSDAAISLSGTAEVFITARAQDMVIQPQPPGGRLTLVTLTPVMLTSQAAKTTVYYTPYSGNYVPIWDGTQHVHTPFSEISQATTDTTKSPAAVGPEAIYDVFVWNDAGTIRATRGPPWLKAATVTMTIASPCVVTWAAHGLNEGDPIVFTNSGGALPTGITAGTAYYVTRSPAAGTFNISTSVANAASNSRVNTSGSQSGTHTGSVRTRDRGTGAGTTELELKDGILTNKQAITNGPAANRGTYVGSIKSNSSSQIDFIYGTSVPARCKLGVWNNYNRVMISTWVNDNNASYTYSGNGVRQVRANVEMRMEWLTGLAQDSPTGFIAYESSLVDATGTFTLAFTNVDSTNSPGTVTGSPIVNGPPCASNSVGSANGSLHITPSAPFVVVPFIGWHYIALCELGDGTQSNTINQNQGNQLGMSLPM